MKQKWFASLLWAVTFMNASLQAQSCFVKGKITSENGPALFAHVYCSDLNFSAETDLEGKYSLGPFPVGEHEIQVSYVSYQSLTSKIVVSETDTLIELNFHLQNQQVLDEVVITGTKTFQRKSSTPVIVNLISRQQIENVQACNVADGLKFQSGLRVETDCQTCNYTQLRMNGLAGGYSQILINGRPVFSPLTGLYGLEQLPSSMLERIEIVRGGASSTFGPGAIGGTVNIITRVPKKSGLEVSSSYHHINRQAQDVVWNGNLTQVNKRQNAGINLLLNYRNRQFYDHNGDAFSELPRLENKALGVTTFWLPKANQKVELNAMLLNEYRRGGDMAQNPVHLLQQAEERKHRVAMANVDYQINSASQNASFIVYAAFQQTLRDHYTGIFPDNEIDIARHLALPPYGDSKVLTGNGGVQYNFRIENMLKGSNTLTAGVEYTAEDVKDEIPAYRYRINQFTSDLGAFVQSQWQWASSFILLSGVRWDKHKLLDQGVWSPRLSLLYKFRPLTQLRVNWGTGFRPPQAFDTDLHIAFAGGGVSRVSLADNLAAEKSQSLSLSFNHDTATEKFVAGFTLEGFYTRLNRAFYLHPLGFDGFGEVFEKRNGTGAEVSGIVLEARANLNQKIQVEAGITLQQSRFRDPVFYIEGIAATREFMRTPSRYGFGVVTWFLSPKTLFTLNYLYTGSMQLPHFSGAPEQTQDEIKTSRPFHELGARFNLTLLKNAKQSLDAFLGCKNLFNSYQADFDTGKNRDSNYVYGPSQPTTIYFGVKYKLE